MANENDQFLKSYKELEETCRGLNIDLKNLADDIGEVDGNKLNICRQMRNYMSHNSEANFLSASKSQISFIQSLNKKMKEKDDICSKHMRKKLDSFSCTTNEKCSDVVNRMVKVKAEYFLVLDSTNQAYSDKSMIKGVVSIYSVAAGLAASKTTRIRDIKTENKVSPYFVDKSDKYSEGLVKDHEISIVVDASTPTGKILGALI